MEVTFDCSKPFTRQLEVMTWDWTSTVYDSTFQTKVWKVFFRSGICGLSLLSLAEKQWNPAESNIICNNMLLKVYRITRRQGSGLKVFFARKPLITSHTIQTRPYHTHTTFHYANYYIQTLPCPPPSPNHTRQEYIIISAPTPSSLQFLSFPFNTRGEPRTKHTASSCFSLFI